MKNQKLLFTSESVGQGHPDKICDQISDAILDAYLKIDPYSRCAIETMASGNEIFIVGEVSSKALIDAKEIAKKTIEDIDDDYKNKSIKIYVNLKQQSSDIAQGVELENGEIGAGDQGIMFGYATNETKTYMPLAITLAHEICKLANNLRLNKEFKWAKSDMKSQVTIDLSNPNRDKVETILFSCQHSENYDEKEFKNFIINRIIRPILDDYDLEMPKNIYINPTGRFVIGGIVGDAGLTGRKIIVDTYGGTAHHGGGAFSGKDATKVDRSAAYMCRYIAKNLVAANIADKVEIQVSYAIGIAKPISIFVDTYNTEKIDKKYILEIVDKVFDLKPSSIIKNLNLKNPIFAQTAYFGHFGREDLNLPWEKTDKVAQIKSFILAKKYHN